MLGDVKDPESSADHNMDRAQANSGLPTNFEHSCVLAAALIRHADAMKRSFRGLVVLLPDPQASTPSQIVLCCIYHHVTDVQRQMTLSDPRISSRNYSTRGRSQP